MVIEMLSGKAPWAGISGDFSEIIGYICSGIHPPIPPKVSKECQYFLESCLDPIANQRLKAHELIKHRFIDRSYLNELKYTEPSDLREMKSKSRG